MQLPTAVGMEGAHEHCVQICAACGFAGWCPCWLGSSLGVSPPSAGQTGRTLCCLHTPSGYWQLGSCVSTHGRAAALGELYSVQPSLSARKSHQRGSSRWCWEAARCWDFTCGVHHRTGLVAASVASPAAVVKPEHGEGVAFGGRKRNTYLGNAWSVFASHGFCRSPLRKVN